MNVEDNFQIGIDLNEQLISNKPATFFFRMNGSSMINKGIFPGDILIVDRSITKVHDKVAILVLNGEMLIRTIHKTVKDIVLFPANKDLQPYTVTPFDNFEIWGVITYSIHSHKDL